MTDLATDNPPTIETTEDIADKYKRALAELDNLRKRKAKELEQIRDFAEAHVLVKVLPIVDDFRRALTALNETAGEDARQRAIDGVQRVFGRFVGILKELEVEGFEAQGKQFAAELMEAVLEMPSKTLPPGTVAAEISQGFTRRGKLLRPAQVAVAIPEPERGDE